MASRAVTQRCVIPKTYTASGFMLNMVPLAWHPLPLVQHHKQRMKIAASSAGLEPAGKLHLPEAA